MFGGQNLHLESIVPNCRTCKLLKVGPSTYRIASNLLYKWHQIKTLNVSCFIHHPVVLAQSIEAMYQVEIEDVVGAAPTGDAPVTSEWLTILLSSSVAYTTGFTAYHTKLV